MTALAGKVVAVTGGARGIGDAAAKALAAAGAQVAIGDVDADLAVEAARAYNGLGLPLDVTSQESFAAFLDAVEAEYGRIDGLVNNAGIMVIGKHLETPLDAQLRQIDVNVRGVILGCHEVAPRMIAAGGGQIINIASLAGRVPTAGSAIYSATKGAVLNFTDAFDNELTGTGVHVAAVLPSFTRTGLVDGTTAPALSPLIEPEEVAAAVVSLMIKHRPTYTVPRRLGLTGGTWSITPRPIRRWLGSKAGLDAVFTEFDHAARADYEQRALRPMATDDRAVGE